MAFVDEEGADFKMTRSPTCSMPCFFKVFKVDEEAEGTVSEELFFFFFNSLTSFGAHSLFSLLAGIDFGFLYLFTVPNLPNFASLMKSFGCVQPVMPS